MPDGATKLENRHGSAPGIWLEDDRGRWVAMLPGVPREMRGMLADTLVPRLVQRGASGTVVRSRTLRTTGIAESMLADRIDSMEGQPLGASLAYLPSATGVDLRLTVRDLPSDDADAALSAAADRLRDRLGDWIYAEQDADLAALVLRSCRERKLTIAVAESCTGGLLGARLTAIAGVERRRARRRDRVSQRREARGARRARRHHSRPRRRERAGRAPNGGGRAARRRTRALVSRSRAWPGQRAERRRSPSARCGSRSTWKGTRRRGSSS